MVKLENVNDLSRQYDAIIHMSKDDPDYHKRLDECTLNHIVSMINCGRVAIKYKAWSFSGGRDYGDCDVFEFYDPNDEIYKGTLDINRSFDEIEFMFQGADGETHLGSVDDFAEGDFDKINQIVDTAMVRDDKVFVEQMQKMYGSFGYPRDYDDIDREMVFDGRFTADGIIENCDDVKKVQSGKKPSVNVNKILSEAENIDNIDKNDNDKVVD